LGTEGRRLINVQLSSLDCSATSENVSVSMRVEFVWHIRGYVRITMNTLSTRY